MNYWPSKKAIGIGVLLLLLVTGGLWLAGRQKNSGNQPAKLSYERREASFPAASSTLANFYRQQQQDSAYIYSFPTSSRQVLDQPMEQIKTLVEQELSQNNQLEQVDQIKIGKTHALMELKLTVTEDGETLHTFGLQLAKILQPYGARRPYEVAVMLRMLETKSQADHDALIRSRQQAEQLIKALLALPNPKSFGPISLALINSLEKQVVLLNNMANIGTKPVVALQSGLIYIQETQGFAERLQAVNRYFLDRGVKFNEQEQASIYLNLQN